MPHIIANGLSLHYEEQGAGEPLICISGLGAGHDSWSLVAPRLAPRFRVITFDNRGMGQTSAPDEPYSIGQMADDTAALMATLGLASAHIAGHSMGSAIALSLAVRHPQNVRKLVLFNPFERIRPAALFAFQTNAHLLREGVPEPLVFEVILPWLFSDNFFEVPDTVRAMMELAASQPPQQTLTGFEHQIDAVAQFTAHGILGHIQAPTLVVAGTHDIMTPADEAQNLAAKIRGAQLATLEAAHLSLIEAPQACAHILLDFLGGQPE